MNNTLGWKTDHSACILEEQRLHVYRWMLKEILNGNTTGEFLCHLLDKYNEQHDTNYKLDQFPELVMQRQSTYSWWGGIGDKNKYKYLNKKHGMDSFKDRMKFRSYVLSDAIEFLMD
jgi:hypothetical protein